MINSKDPLFIIKRCMQKSLVTGVYFDDLISDSDLETICYSLTGKKSFKVEFVENDYCDEFLPATYNKGRMGILLYNNCVSYISFSDEKCGGRNSGIQSVPTAFNLFYLNKHPNKQLYFYFLPCSGNNATSYYIFMYRLMKTAGFNFINSPPSFTKQDLSAFSNIDDIIRARKENRDKNSGNNAIYLLKNASHEYQIYGKTYGANKYDTSLICFAISKLATTEDHIILYEYNEKDLKELPSASLEVIRKMGNIEVVNIDDEIEKRALEENDSIRSPRFQAHLLEHLGERHCVLCNCCLSEIIQAAHIWPVSEIKKDNSLSLEEKIRFATDGENGLWLCQNHHKMFDSNILTLSYNGEISFKENLSSEDKDYIKSVTTIKSLPHKLITPRYIEYIKRRYKRGFEHMCG